MDAEIMCQHCRHAIHPVTEEHLAQLAILSSLENSPLQLSDVDRVLPKYTDQSGNVNYETLITANRYIHGLVSLRCPTCRNMNYLFNEVYLTARGMEWDIIMTTHQQVRDELALFLDATNRRLFPQVLDMFQQQ